MERTFKITWDDELGSEWMNLENLAMCLFSEQYISGDAKDLIQVVEVAATCKVVLN